MKKLFKMFLIFLRIGAFTFGGGYAMIPLIEDEMVNKQKWINEEEFLDIIALSQSIPGVLAVNCSTYVGYSLFGLKGAIIACLGAVLPSFFIILTIAMFLINAFDESLLDQIFNGIRPAVVGLIVVAVFKLKRGIKKTYFNYIYAFIVFIAVSFFNVHPIFVILISGILGYIIYKGVNFDESNS